MNDRRIRPNHNPDRKVSFVWDPGVALVELVYDKSKGLLFAIRDCVGKVSYSRTHLEYQVLSWLEPYARTRTLRLPAQADPYGTLDELAGRVRTFIHSYFDCDATFEAVATLYAMHTWLYEAFDAVPYLRFLGGFGTGKSRATQTVGALCYRPLVIAGSLTGPVMFRQIEAVGGTVLMDEADFSDSAIGADVAKVLNCGYSQGLPVSRMEKIDDGPHVPRLYEVFGPKILNGRKRFKDEATESRCLPYTPSITARRDIPVQKPDSFETEAVQLQNQLLQWRFDTLETLKPSGEYISGVSPRMNQIILPLLTLTKLLSDPTSYQSDLLRFARGIDQQAKDVSRESAEAAIVRALSKFATEGKAPTCKEIADDVIAAEYTCIADLDRWLNPRKVGEIVRDQLGFRTKHTEKGTIVLLDSHRLSELETKYGIGYPCTEAHEVESGNEAPAIFESQSTMSINPS